MQRSPEETFTASSDHSIALSPNAIDSLTFAQKRPSHETASNNAAAANSAAAPVSRIRRRNRMITSCLECRRRKLKCDKSHPCLNCTKASRDCIFLAPALDTASQLKLTEIKEKMGSLERVLEQDVARSARNRDIAATSYATEEEFDFAPVPEDERELEPSPMAVLDAVYEEDGDDDLMDLGIKLGKLRLTERIGGFFRPKMKEEINVSLSDSRNSRRPPQEGGVDTPYAPLPKERPEDWLAPGPTYIPPSSSFFFSSGNGGTSLIDYLPSMDAADHLLQQYWDCVHPIARVVHRPSFQRRYDTFWQEVQLGIEPVGSLQAIVFAAMFSGVVSMPDHQIFRDFGVLKKDLLTNFQQGTETALARANLLRTTKIETMQAFVMYMVCCCRAEMSRSHSALIGTGIRLAECMGLHRDGTGYGMGAVETHVRRLVWYQLCFLDIRTCEAQGPRPGIRPEDFDTKLPLNVEDDELEWENPPTKSSRRWTSMTCTLIRLECNEMHRQIWLDRPALEKKQISLTAILGKIENCKRILLERYLPLIDDSIPLQQCAHLMFNILIARMYIMVLHRYHNGVSVQIPDRLRQIILTSGTEQLENAVALETLPQLQPWFWYSGAIQQYQTAFLLLAEVFAYPMRKEADRIWAALDYVFELPPHLIREDKARLVLSELSERIGTYRDARKLRAPMGMLQRVGLQPPRKVEGSKKQHSNFNFDRLQFPMGDPAATVPPPLEPDQGSQREGSAPSAASSTPAPPEMPPLGDDLMAEIDWNEWDKLFPPDVNTGNLDLTPPDINTINTGVLDLPPLADSSSTSTGFPHPAMYTGR